MRSEEQATFKAVTVGRRGLELLRPLVERFCAAGVTQWDSDTLLRVAWHRLGTPLFRVWALVRQGSNEPLGFLVAQVQAADAQTELYLLAAEPEAPGAADVIDGKAAAPESPETKEEAQSDE